MGLARGCGSIVLGMLAACSLYSATNPVVEGSPPDGGPADGAIGDDASGGETGVGADAGGDADLDAPAAGSNLLTNGDFESATSCAGWSAGGPTAMLSDDNTMPHGGIRACHVCGNDTVFDAQQMVATSIASGTRLKASVWVRADVDGTLAQAQLSVDGASQMTPLGAASTTWTERTVTLTAPKASAFVTLSVASGSSGTLTCISIDDAVVVEGP
jgi:hypothetical protein